MYCSLSYLEHVTLMLLINASPPPHGDLLQVSPMHALCISTPRVSLADSLYAKRKIRTQGKSAVSMQEVQIKFAMKPYQAHCAPD